MINKNNELPSFVNETNLPKIVDKLTDASNIKIANNKYGNRVQTVIDKIVEKADDVTKAIKQEVVNDSYSFKVGTGDVDVSADVQDGFGEIGIKGVAYQNLWFGTVDGANITNRVYSPPEYRGECSANSDCGFTIDTDMIKPNVDYTVVFDVKCEVVGILPKVMLFDKGTLSNPKSFNLTNIDATTFKTIVLKIRTDKNGCKILVGFNAGGQEVKGAQMVVKNIIILEGDHTNNPNLPSYFEGIVGVGDKSKNLFNPKDLVVGALNFAVGSNINQIANHATTRLRSDVSKPIEIKPNTQYSIKLNQNFSIGFQEYDSNKIALRDSTWRTGEVKITTTSNSKYVYFVIKRNGTESPIEIKELDNGVLQIEEGDTLSEYQPYGTHKIEILSCGKNLINIKDMPLGNLENSGKVVMSPTSAYKVTPNFIKIEPTRKVCFYYEYEKNDTSTPQHNMIAYYDENFSYLGAIYDRPPKGAIITPHTKAKYIRLRVRKETVKLSLVFSSDIVYEPYIEDKTQILLDEPLMRLPNGVCDEITRDGKLIRRVGKKFIDANISGLSHNGTSSNHNQFVIHKGVVTPNSINHANLLCDKKPCKVDNSGNNSVWVYNKATLVFQMDSTINSVEKMRQWLSQNPTTVYYELETPIITELPAPCLRIFKDGHLTFNTLVAPESSHVVQLNKSAQIQNAIKESQSLDNRINVLENNYDNLMLSTISRLNDLELNYTLK